MGEASSHIHQAEVATPDSSPALAASSRRLRTPRYYPAGATHSPTKLEHRPIPPERGSRRFCVVGGQRSRGRGLWQQACRGLIHGCDTLWRSERYPLRAPQSNRGTAAVGSRRASADDRAGHREQRVPGTCPSQRTVGSIDRCGGRGDGAAPLCQIGIVASASALALAGAGVGALLTSPGSVPRLRERQPTYRRGWR